MNMQILKYICVCAILTTGRAQPVEVSDAVVEIEKQKLIKFPDEVDQQQHDSKSASTSQPDKQDEAKRILQEIEKINHALGYVRKQPEQPPKLPPILDSSQYLFPKPPVQPFHQQNHQTAGLHGETILIPSIRAIRVDGADLQYNVPPMWSKQATPHIKRDNKLAQSSNIDYYFRPNHVLLPAPQTAQEQQQLPTHFVIPVRLYKLNKEEYMRKHAPQEYRVKGYKIVGDIDNFYGKAKQQQQQKNKTHKQKNTPKYHLFFLPREMVLNEDATLKHSLETANTAEQHVEAKEETEELLKPQSQLPSAQDSNSREVKVANRPFKLQTTTTTNTNGQSLTNTTTQIIRNRVVPQRPLRPEQQQQQQQQPHLHQQQQHNKGGTITAIHITPQQPNGPNTSPISNSNTNSNSNSNSNSNLNGNANSPQDATIPMSNPSVTLNTGGSGSGIGGFPLFNLRPAHNNNNYLLNPLSNDMKNNTAVASNAIKNAFQNIFKFPFRQDTKTESSTSSPSAMQYVPQQTPPKTFFNSPFMQSQAALKPTYSNQNNGGSASPTSDQDYRWEDESSNSAADEDSDSGGISVEQEEKKIFDLHNNFPGLASASQDTQKEALKEGGIIIQRLKVRKGGIAIAGPGGVATAGSGGTAIVGPGGYALTHPRSLTIAGPGAKVIAIPANVDLKDALQRTNLSTRSFPREGKIVATGPTVYYAPTTSTGTGTGIDAIATTSVETWPPRLAVLPVAALTTSASEAAPLLTSRTASVTPAVLPAINLPPSLPEARLIDPAQFLRAAARQPLLYYNTPFYAPTYNQPLVSNTLLSFSSMLQAASDEERKEAAPEATKKAPEKLIKSATKQTKAITKALKQTSTTSNPRKLTSRPTKIAATPIKFQVAPAHEVDAGTKIVPPADFKSDARLLAAVSRINPEFVIEEILPVPGKHILSAISSEKIVQRTAQKQQLRDQAPSASAFRPTPVKSLALQTHSIKLKQNAKPGTATQSLPLVKRTAPAHASDLKVESVGRTATSGNIPQIPFGTYFLPYFADAPLQYATGKTAALILEPHSKAVVGNGGTAISRPISKAFLKRGVPTNVYFNPESVAIAGVGGKAHAQADLELDLVDT